MPRNLHPWHMGEFNNDRITVNRTRSRRMFGIELETSEVNGDTCIEPEDCTWIGDSIFGAKYDGSVDGLEFVSPPMSGDEGLREVEIFCDLANDYDCQVDDSCGYHLHLDLGAEPLERLKSIAIAYHHTYPVWRNCVDRSRQNRSWCPAHRWERVEVNRLADQHGWENFARFQDRYQWANFRAYMTHKTVEIRLHDGTLDPTEINNWVLAHLWFIDTVADMSPTKLARMFGRKSVATMFREFRAIWQDADLSEYYGARVRRNCEDVSKVLISPKDR